MSEAAEEVLGLAEHLLRIPSPIGEERALADDLEQRFAGRGMHEVVRAGNSLCVVPRPPRDGARTLMLVGHLDTVPALDDNPVRREGDRLFGLGASDMKAADACIVWALERARRQEPRHGLVGVLYAREEGPYDESEMPLVVEAARGWFDRADLAVCMEPTDNRIELGCLGTAHLRVVFSGRRAHSARPWQGDNAIHEAHGLLARLAAREPVAHTFHGLTFTEVVSATMAEYRGARNVVPDRFELNLNHRFAPGQDEAAVRRTAAELVQGEAEWELVDFCPAGRVCGDNPLLAELREHLPGAEVTAKQAWTDVGRLSQLGLDAVNWGPGATSQAHQAGEWVSVTAVGEAVAVLGAWLFGD